MKKDKKETDSYTEKKTERGLKRRMCRDLLDKAVCIVQHPAVYK